ncbi:hypothetical protein [Kordia sp.]|uniref:hypothetical protein n=1 Tax=Kordia sp. TaxID=1965332 RepID=UPI0025B80C53|nr:hypothetical protein [Kordia sp.]MCH2194906.1 hypothetical protein [Kordia sp.]
MKKRNVTILALNKRAISSLRSTNATGGFSKKCYHTIKLECNTERCNSNAYHDCTVTYTLCITEPRFCG